MTAQRWWVKLGARWLARIDGVSGQIRVASLGVTAFSTFSLLLQNSGHGELVMPLGLFGLIAVPTYTYLYTEGGVWNQMARDRVDLSTNYAGPTMRIQSEMMARALLAAEKGEPLTTEEREATSEELDAAWTEYRDGLNESYLQE